MPPIVTPDVNAAAEALRSGRLVAMPTETVYGLAAPIASPRSVRAVFELKGRPLFDPLIVHVAGIDDAKLLVARWPEEAQILAERFWPGPLSLVIDKADSVDPLITAGLDTIAVRCPDHALARELITLTGPLAAPSANRFGRTSPTTPQHVLDEFPHADDLLILDGGECEAGIESTVIRIDTKANSLELLRPGPVTPGEIMAALQSQGIRRDLLDMTSDFRHSANPGARFTDEPALPAPGMLERHYQPSRPLVIVIAEADTPLERLQQQAAAVIGATDTQTIGELSLGQSPLLAARTLYANMRTLAERPDTEAMLVRRSNTQNDEAWNAVWNRLERAASAVVGG